jgi:hypoxanthine phosphoribosyltransferase
MIQIKDKTFQIFIPQSELTARIGVAAERINRDYEGKNPLFVAILNGSFMFAADLLKKVSVPCQVTFVKVASYQAMHSTGQVKDLIGLSEDLGGRDVIVLEDIVDTGITMQQIITSLKAKNPLSVKTAVLLFKPEALQQEVPLDYVCFEIANRFVVGYGLDYDGYGRNLPNLYVLKES